MHAAAVSLLMVSLAGCGETGTTTPPVLGPPTTSEPSADVDVQVALVRRDGGSFAVVPGPAGHPDGAGRLVSCSRVAGGVDLCAGGDAYRSFVRWTPNRGVDWHRAVADLAGRMPWPADSLVPGTFVVAGGSDGATLFPFERVIRSTDGGATWTAYDVELVDGERAYTSGHVVLSDGRLLVVVEAWSDDRLDQRSSRHHGLWVSDLDDLSRYRPLEPRFDPPLPARPDARSALESLAASSAPDPVIWATTADDRIYASTDDGRTFREIPAG